MPKSSTSFHFPDLNVWLALSYERHVHYSSAHKWFRTLDDDARLCFCRFTQIGLLRLLTTDAIMGRDKALTQAAAWSIYDRWLEDDRILFLDEPPSMEANFRAISKQSRPMPKDWADSYLLAFASSAGLRFVTFDHAIKYKDANVLLLR